jgi:glycosyltransferase involved in cell wall biosynthesis
MRILYTVLLPNIAGGEKVCLDIMRSARDRGHTVCLLVPASGSVLDTAKAEGFEAYIFPMERTFQIHRAIAFARFLRKWKADLVHTHIGLQGMVLARIGARLAGVPIVNHIHLNHSFNKNPIIQTIQRFADNNTTHLASSLIAVSEDTKRLMEKDGNPPSKLVVIPNGTTLQSVTTSEEILQTKSDLGLSGESIVVGCVARLNPSKGQHHLLEILPRLLRENNYIIVLFIGEDTSEAQLYLQQLEQIVADNNLDNSVLFLGFRNDVSRLMKGFDIFVLPTYREAMPLTILEAMAAGKPVVSTKVNGIPEVVIDGQTGLLVEAGDAEALADALISLIRNPHLAQEMGQAGRNRVEQHFDLARVHQQVFDLYEEVEGK